MPGAPFQTDLASNLVSAKLRFGERPLGKDQSDYNAGAE
jgi:hypothetical protein